MCVCACCVRRRSKPCLCMLNIVYPPSYIPSYILQRCCSLVVFGAVGVTSSVVWNVLDSIFHLLAHPILNPIPAKSNTELFWTILVPAWSLAIMVLVCTCTCICSWGWFWEGLGGLNFIGNTGLHFTLFPCLLMSCSSLYVRVCVCSCMHVHVYVCNFC